MAWRSFAVVNERTGATVGSSVRDAAGLWPSFKGLMFVASMLEGEGMVFRPARGIHTHLMRFAIDLVFLDAADRVMKIRPAMLPWRFDFTNAAGVIELNAGAAERADIRPGDQLRFELRS